MKELVCQVDNQSSFIGVDVDGGAGVIDHHLELQVVEGRVILGILGMPGESNDVIHGDEDLARFVDGVGLIVDGEQLDVGGVNEIQPNAGTGLGDAVIEAEFGAIPQVGVTGVAVGQHEGLSLIEAVAVIRQHQVSTPRETMIKQIVLSLDGLTLGSHDGLVVLDETIEAIEHDDGDGDAQAQSDGQEDAHDGPNDVFFHRISPFTCGSKVYCIPRRSRIICDYLQL